MHYIVEVLIMCILGVCAYLLGMAHGIEVGEERSEKSSYDDKDDTVDNTGYYDSLVWPTEDYEINLDPRTR